MSRFGVPALALVMLAAAAMVALLVPGPGRNPGPPGLAFVVAASIPWLRWSPGEDDGPTWSYATFALAPVAALGIGQWSGAHFGLAKDWP